MNQTDEQKTLAAQRLRSRNRAVLGLLVAFIVIIFIITLLKAK